MEIVIPAGESTFVNLAGLTIDRLTLGGNNTIFLPQQLTLNGSASGNQIISNGNSNVFLGAGGINLTGIEPRVNVAAQHHPDVRDHPDRAVEAGQERGRDARDSPARRATSGPPTWTRGRCS